MDFFFRYLMKPFEDALGLHSYSTETGAVKNTPEDCDVVLSKRQISPNLKLPNLDKGVNQDF